MTKTIYIVGLGLIGGSIALGIRKAHPEYRLLGYNRGESSRTVALERGMVDEVTADFASFAPLADVIILAVPIKQTISFIQKLGQLQLKDKVLITDAGSTKLEIVKAAETSLDKDKVRFVGGHPMAGSHKSGAKAADVHLFENAYYILTPSQLTTQESLAELKDLLSGLGVRLTEMSAEEHDQVTAQVSHFPHVLASSLMLQTGDYRERHTMTNYLAAGGFRDMTRIAESEPGMWTSILLTNKAAVIERIDDFKEQLDRVASWLENHDEAAIWDFFNQGSNIRKDMDIHKRGGVDSFYDLYISIPDEEGKILKIMALLQGISLVNIRINENNREDLYGVLQITVKTKADQLTAKDRIEQATSYQVVIE